MRDVGHHVWGIGLDDDTVKREGTILNHITQVLAVCVFAQESGDTNVESLCKVYFHLICISGEAVDDHWGQIGVLVQNLHNGLMGITVVDKKRLLVLDGKLYLFLEGSLLGITWGVFAVESSPHSPMATTSGPLQSSSSCSAARSFQSSLTK